MGLQQFDSEKHMRHGKTYHQTTQVKCHNCEERSEIIRVQFFKQFNLDESDPGSGTPMFCNVGSLLNNWTLIPDSKTWYFQIWDRFNPG